MLLKAPYFPPSLLYIIALGVKEVWEVPAHVFKKGYIQHTLGWPLQSAVMGADTFGGSFLYHQEPNVSSILQLG